MRQDSNLRHLVLETSALTGLSYAPKSFRPDTLGCRTEGTFFTAMGYKAGSFSHPLTQIL